MEKEYKIKPFKTLVIGDPKYLVNMSTKKSTTMYIANYNKIPNNEKKRICGVYLTEENNDIFSKKKILIYSVKNNEMGEILISAHKDGKSASSLIEKYKDLKNDTGNIGIIVDDKKIMLPVGNDQKYGCTYEYKKGLAYITEIEITDIEISFDMCDKIINSLFEIIKEGE